jgi:hypothetical protein
MLSPGPASAGNPPANPLLLPSASVSISTIEGLVLRVDSTTGLVYFGTPSPAGADPSSLFVLINLEDPSKPVQPGDPVVVKNVLTGKYCAFSQPVPQSLLSLPDEDSRRRSLHAHITLPQSCGLKCMTCDHSSLEQASRLGYRRVCMLLCACMALCQF